MTDMRIGEEMWNAMLMARWESWAADAGLVLRMSCERESFTDDEREIFERAKELEAQIEEFRKIVFEKMEKSLLNVKKMVEEE